LNTRTIRATEILAWLTRVCLGGMGLLFAVSSPAALTNDRVQIRALTVNGANIPLGTSGRHRLPPAPETVSLGFGPVTNLSQNPLRIRFKLDGFDNDWREPAGEMRLSIRFFDESGDQLSEVLFRAAGQTPGWTGSADNSPFLRRSEAVTVPPSARGFWVVLSSAGPPTTVGVYAVSDLSVSRERGPGRPPEVLVPWALDPATEKPGADGMPAGWIRDGLRPSMAQILNLNTTGKTRAFGIIDDDTNGHAEWHTLKEFAPPVSAGERLVISWSEAFSFGLAGAAEVNYADLPAGYFRFRVNELALGGAPREAEASLEFDVPQAFWKTPWFWVSLLTAAGAAGVGAWRYLWWRRLQYQLALLEQQRAIERERLRIAQDIHDDLGARVTQISLLSAVAQRKPSLSDEARADFGTVSQMTRDLVSALYETVWAVNPENDNLEALGNFLCQMGTLLCTPAQLPCRLEVPDLPPSVPLTSQVRHNLIMAAKEAIHNVIKHAHATEVRIRIVFQAAALSISIQDDGCGFDPNATTHGNGLDNLKRRLEAIGGTFTLESQPGKGTTVVLRLRIPGESPKVNEETRN